jgi:hypothetical protein
MTLQMQQRKARHVAHLAQLHRVEAGSSGVIFPSVEAVKISTGVQVGFEVPAVAVGVEVSVVHWQKMWWTSVGAISGRFYGEALLTFRKKFECILFFVGFNFTFAPLFEQVNEIRIK